jgi:hypothetical protein
MPGTVSATSRKAAPALKWGAGRVAFFACLGEIRDEIRQGWPLTAIHARHRKKLRVSYSGFCKLVGRHAADARIASSPPRPAPPDAAEPAAVPGGTTGRTGDGTRAGPPDGKIPMQGVPPHDGPRPGRTFVHDPVERPGDYERLLGTRGR